MLNFISPPGKADGIFRLMLGNVIFKGRRRAAFTVFNLNGDDFCPILEGKIYFAGFVGKIVWLHIELAAKLL